MAVAAPEKVGDDLGLAVCYPSCAEPIEVFERALLGFILIYRLFSPIIMLMSAV